ncbi:MAG: alpha-L-arabinofuranosidase C-terminal domain-containing protein, partial [Verrucomicrobiota bacterium]
GRIPMATSANCLQPDGQNDNDWNQGLLFLNQSKAWLQPPGYVTQMFSHQFLPKVVPCQVTDGNGNLDATAKRSDDGKTLTLQAVNPTDQPLIAQIAVSGFVPKKSVARAVELSAPLSAENSADQPDTVVPKTASWTHGLKSGATRFTFAAHSITILRFE